MWEQSRQADGGVELSQVSWETFVNTPYSGPSPEAGPESPVLQTKHTGLYELMDPNTGSHLLLLGKLTPVLLSLIFLI